MLKPMGFRGLTHRGFDLGGKTMEYALIAALVGIIVLALVLAVTQTCDRRGGMKLIGDLRAKCLQCDHEWDIEPDQIQEFGEGMMDDMRGMDCPKCGAKSSAFLMVRCPEPECGKFYMSKRFTDPEAAGGFMVRDVCPHCGTNLVEWYKKRPGRR